jgi:hypothetical protein
MYNFVADHMNNYILEEVYMKLLLEMDIVASREELFVEILISLAVEL